MRVQPESCARSLAYYLYYVERFQRANQTTSKTQDILNICRVLSTDATKRQGKQ